VSSNLDPTPGSALGSAHAPTLAASGGAVAALVVTVVVLLLLGALFWAFLRRGRAEGVAPLAVDRLGAHSPGGGSSGVPAAAPTVDDEVETEAEVQQAIEAEIDEGGPLDGAGPGPTT
jgi:hypothetical protein